MKFPADIKMMLWTGMLTCLTVAIGVLTIVAAPTTRWIAVA
jgi:hypothetical protein